MKVSHYQIGMIGIRADKIGQAGNLLKKIGFMRIGAGEINNRNAFTHIKFCAKKEDLIDIPLNDLKSRGFVGMSFFLTDAQWGKNKALTDKQWQDRCII